MKSPRKSARGKAKVAAARKPVDRYRFRLYITGLRQRSLDAIADVRRLCDEYLPGKTDLEIIDLYQQPERAAAQHVIAAPTLIKESPAPLRRLTGDLSNSREVLAALGVGA